MKINSIDNTKFNGIYSIPKTPKNIEEIQKYVIPAFNNVRHESICIFSGNNPFKILLDIIKEKVAKDNHSSVDWLMANASRHGLKLDEAGDDVLHVLSGEKEIGNLIEYLQSRLGTEKTFVQKIKGLFIKDKSHTFTIQEDLPEHLRVLSIFLQNNQREDAAFKEYAKNVVHVETAQDLFKKVMTERL